MLKERALKYREDSNYKLNCSECIMYAANEEYNLGISNEVLKAMSGFGGGVCTGNICGAVSGAVAVIGVMFAEGDKGNTNPKVRAMTQELVKRFTEEVGYLDCRDIKGKIKDENLKACNRMIAIGCDTLENIIKQG